MTFFKSKIAFGVILGIVLAFPIRSKSEEFDLHLSKKYSLIMSRYDNLCRPLTDLYNRFLDNPGSLPRIDYDYRGVVDGPIWEKKYISKFRELFPSPEKYQQKTTTNSSDFYYGDIFGQKSKRIFLNYHDYTQGTESDTIIILKDGVNYAEESPSDISSRINPGVSSVVSTKIIEETVNFKFFNIKKIDIRDTVSLSVFGSSKLDFGDSVSYVPQEWDKKIPVPWLGNNTVQTPLMFDGTVYFISSSPFHGATPVYRKDLVLVYQLRPNKKIHDICYIYRDFSALR